LKITVNGKLHGSPYNVNIWLTSIPSPDDSRPTTGAIDLMFLVFQQNAGYFMSMVCGRPQGRKGSGSWGQRG